MPTHLSKRERELYHEIAQEKKIEVSDDGFLSKLF